MRTTVFLFAILGLALAAAAPALAQTDQAQTAPRHHARSGQDWAAALTPDQRATVKRLALEYADETAPIYAKLNRTYTELYWAMQDEHPDRAAVLPLARRLGAVQAELYEKQIDFQLRLLEDGLPPEALSALITSPANRNPTLHGLPPLPAGTVWH